MPYLEACYEGDNPSLTRRWRKLLPLDREVTIGRIPTNHPDPSTESWNKADWEIPESNDTYVSGCHAILKWVSFEGKLHVKRRMRPRGTANPILFNSRPTDVFTMFPGESFSIGKHRFSLHDADSIPDEPPESQFVESQPISIDEPPPLPEPVRVPPVAEQKPSPVPVPAPVQSPGPVTSPRQSGPLPIPKLDAKPEPSPRQSGPMPILRADSPPLEKIDEGVHVSMSPEAIQDQDFVNAQARLKALTRLIDLPKKGIMVDELERNLVQLLLDALPNATGVAIIQLTPDCTAQSPECKVRRAWKRREGNVPRYPVSNRLAYNVIRRRPECRLQLWFRGGDSTESGGGAANFTVIGNGIDWTICCPLMSEYTQDLGIYVDGELPRNITKNALDTFEREELHDYQKFVEQAARILTSVRMIRALEKRTKQLEQFVPPMVLMAMKKLDVQTLFAPKPTKVSVLFCDLRSSCKVAEDAVTPQVLNDLGSRIREALGVMTQAINTNDGVVGDLQGDAAMGFWGWPVDQNDQIDRAARAALDIRNRFFNQVGMSRSNDGSELRCGIGIAHGLALAGAMGTTEHIKSDVFGPVVNLAARLEGMTKALGSPILVDEEIGNYLRNYKTTQIAAPRARLMGRFLPAGMTKPVIVYELLPPEGARGKNMDENSRRLWEVAVEDFMTGNWNESRQKLDDFILQHSGSVDHSGSTMLSTRPEELKAAYLMLDFMQRNNYTVPISLQYWRTNGAIDLPK